MFISEIKRENILRIFVIKMKICEVCICSIWKDFK